jgi:leucyl aminopeptidase
MKISLKKIELTSIVADVLVVTVFEGEKPRKGGAREVDQILQGDLSRFAHEEAFTGKLGETLLVRMRGLLKTPRVILVGLGRRNQCGPEAVRQASAASFALAKKLTAKKIASVLHGAEQGCLSPILAAQAVVEGVRLADYGFTRYKKPEETSPEEVVIVTPDVRAARSAEKGIRLGEITAKATIYARDLVNTPANHQSPKDLVEAAEDLAKDHPSISVEVFDKKALHEMKAGGLLGVAQGSDLDPYLVHLIYTPRKKTKRKIALVGKALTFDSGGLSLKPTAFMLGMKMDMAGAAAVIGVFSVLSDLALDIEMHGIFGACENMPSGKAMRPGDVVEIMNGKTVEIVDTDAEGRVTLADSLSFAARLGPQVIIDLATLTGSCLVALGEEVAGIMGNQEKLLARLQKAAQEAGEKLWPLPLEDNYRKELKSEIADFKNLGGRWGGALTAGLFLQEFVGKIPWAHLDIAGPAYAEKPLNPYTKQGATGFGVRTLIAWLRTLS